MIQAQSSGLQINILIASITFKVALSPLSPSMTMFWTENWKCKFVNVKYREKILIDNKSWRRGQYEELTIRV